MKFTALLQYVTPHRHTLLAIVALLLLESAFSLTSPWIAGQLTGLALGEPQVLFSSIGWALIAWLVLMTLKSLLGFVSSYLVGSTSGKRPQNTRRYFKQNQKETFL